MPSDGTNLSGEPNDKDFYQNTMKVKAIIERASDGTFACCAEKSICKALPVGYGDCAEEAKEDMLVALEEMRLINKENGVEMPAVDFTYYYDIPSILDAFPYFCIDKLAKLAGFSASQMHQLSSGAVKASEKDFLRLKNAIEKVKRDMAQVVL